MAVTGSLHPSGLHASHADSLTVWPLWGGAGSGADQHFKAHTKSAEPVVAQGTPKMQKDGRQGWTAECQQDGNSPPMQGPPASLELASPKVGDRCSGFAHHPPPHASLPPLAPFGLQTLGP